MSPEGNLGSSISTGNEEAFFKRTIIAYHLYLRKSAKLWQYAIAVFLKNASTLRVEQLS